MNRPHATAGAVLVVATACAVLLAGCGADVAVDEGPDRSRATGTGFEENCSGDPTPAQTEGPYFSPDAPEKADLAADVEDEGTVAIISGTVFDSSCEPAAGLRVDFWQTDARGEYDNQGYRLRGHQLTSDDGRYRFRTVLPGEYSGRTEHIHVKISADAGNEDVLTTQLYVPGMSSAAEDPGIYDEENLLRVVDAASNPRRYRFDFVLP